MGAAKTTTKRITVEKAVSRLKRFKTVKGIERAVRDTVGPRCVPGNGTKCAIAAYLRKITGKAVHVDGNVATYTQRGESIDVELPRTVRDFISEFDNGTMHSITQKKHRQSAA